ncbi:uncharacterized protein [Macrobrachium rosenbergii]|uniref:uncharacterized protein n=1 Tax=Macrobrachium rosenbergii TaxID=79674 RepID=UPI0034D5B524
MQEAIASACAEACSPVGLAAASRTTSQPTPGPASPSCGLPWLNCWEPRTTPPQRTNPSGPTPAERFQVPKSSLMARCNHETGNISCRGSSSVEDRPRADAPHPQLNKPMGNPRSRRVAMVIATPTSAEARRGRQSSFLAGHTSTEQPPSQVATAVIRHPRLRQSRRRPPTTNYLQGPFRWNGTGRLPAGNLRRNAPGPIDRKSPPSESPGSAAAFLPPQTRLQHAPHQSQARRPGRTASNSSSQAGGVSQLSSRSRGTFSVPPGTGTPDAPRREMVKSPPGRQDSVSRRH